MVSFGDAAIEISTLNGIIDHTKLKNLDYASAGHTGSLDLGASDFITTGNISATTISGTTISGTNIYGTTISGTTYRGTNIYGTTLISGPTIIGTTVSGTNINATPSYTGGFTSAGVQGGIYVPRRTDAAANDFSVGDFTTDATWNDLDLSGIIPVGAKAVVVKILARDGSVNFSFQFRKKGNSNVTEYFGIRTQVNNIYIANQGVVECDSDRVIQYFGSNTTWTAVYVHIMGWYI